MGGRQPDGGTSWRKGPAEKLLLPPAGRAEVRPKHPQGRHDTQHRTSRRELRCPPATRQDAPRTERQHVRISPARSATPSHSPACSRNMQANGPLVVRDTVEGRGPPSLGCPRVRPRRRAGKPWQTRAEDLRPEGRRRVGRYLLSSGVQRGPWSDPAAKRPGQIPKAPGPHRKARPPRRKRPGTSGRRRRLRVPPKRARDSLVSECPTMPPYDRLT